MKTADLVLGLRLENKSYNEISKILEISKATVSYHCIKQQINAPINGHTNDRVLTDNEIAIMNEYYITHTAGETAKHFNISLSVVKRYSDNKRIHLTEEEKRKKNYWHVKSRRQKLKEMAVEHLGGKCQICGYSKCIRALDFHHRDSKTKDFSISKNCNMAWNKILVELEKCDLLCSNCHREVHHENYM